MNNKNIKLQELKRWLKTSLKNKVSINQKTVITYLMLGIAGFFGLSLELRAAWVENDQVKYYVNFDGDGRFIASGNNRDKALIGSVIIANSNNINVPLGDSVVLGYKASVDIEAPSTLTINGRFATNFNKGIIALGNVKISNNPYELGRTGNGGQSIAIGDFATSTSQSVAIGSDTYSIGGSSIAIGGDDIASYKDPITTYDYNTYFKRLYDKIGKYNSGSIYSPNVAGGEGSISIGSRTVAYKEGSTSLGTMAYALGKGATALGTQSRAEGTGSIAIGNLTRNFADQALAIGNDSQIRKTGGTAVGLKANSAGEGAIAIGTEVYANASISDGIKDIKNKSIDEAEGYLDNLRANTIKLNDISGIVKNRNETNINDDVSISSEDLDKLNKDNKLSKNAIVIGTKSAAVGDNSIVIGRGSFAFSKNSFALGSYSYAEAENGSAIGIGAKSISYDGAGVASNSNYMHTGKNAMAIGNNSVSSLENSVALGFKSRTDYLHSDLLKPGWVPEGATSIPSSGKTGVISVGAKGFERRIVNVAPGYRGTDAVNVDQLKTLVNRLENKQYNSNLSVQYLSVEKTKGDAKDISDKIELNSKYLEYVDLKEQLEIIKARKKFKDEEIVESTKKVIEDRIKELEKNPLIKTTAGDMGTYSSDSMTVGSTQNEKDQKFEEFISNLKAKKDKALEEENKKPLFGNKTLKDVLANTNYNNDGASGKDSLAFGYKASTTAAADKSISIGYMTTSQSSNSIAIGSRGDDVTKASGTSSVAIGQGAQTTGGYSLGIGGNVRATGATSIAIGDRTSSEAANSIAIGSKGDDYTKASGTSSIAIGQGAQTTGGYALGIGGNVRATGATSIAIGDRAQTTGISSVAVGPAAQGLGENSVAIGNASKAEFKNSVALGSGVTAQESEGNGYLTNQPFSDKGKVISVGYRRINQLADGKEDNEAVTVAQLKSAAPEIEAEVGNKISTVPGANIKVQSGDFNGKDNLRYVGENLSTHIGGSTSAPVISVGIKEEPKFKTLKLNNKNNNAKDLTLSVDNNGNLNLATNNTDTKAKITNVANGTADNDAVNYSQLIGAAPILQAQNSANLTDNKLSTSIGATIKVQADSWGSGDSRYVGENLSTYIGGSASAPVLSIGLKENPKFKTLKINNGANSSQDLTLSADNTGNLSIGSKKITNVANGTDDNDVVNLSQLKGAKSKVEAVANSGITVNAGTAGADGTTYTVGLDENKVKEIAGTNNKGNVTSSDITITNGNGRLIGGDAMTLTIANNAITKDKIKNGAVTADKLDSDLNTKINNGNTVASNVIRLTGDGTSKTDNVALSKQGGIEFAINGKSGEIVTKASGNKVEIGLNSSLKDKLDKLAADPNATYATKSENTAKADKTLANLEESGKNVIKDEAGKAVKVTSGTGTKVETSTDNHITTYKVSLGEEVSNKIDGALSKTEASNTYVTKTDVVDTKIKYTANTNTSKKEIKLSEGFDFKDGTNTTAEVGDNGVVKFNLKSNLTGITSISSGENKAKLTLDDSITVNSKKITGLTDAELNGTSTDAVTGKQLNTTNTNVTNLTNKIDGISNNITTLTNGGIKFKGNDDGEVTTALGSKLNLVGEGTVAGETASDNIKVEKGNSTDTLTFKLSKDLKNLKSIELKNGDKSSTLTLNDTGDVTIGGNTIVTSNNIGTQTIGYKAGAETTVKTTTLTSGLHFKSEGTNLSVKSEDGGVVTYSLKETNSINKTAGTTGNSENKLTTEKAVVDYVKNEISGVNTNVGNVSLTLSKDGTEESSKINLKDDKLTVKGENGVDVSISDKAITVKIDNDTKAKIDKIGESSSDGRDGKEGKAGETSSATNGLTGKDGLNGKDLTSKVNALRNGEAGSVVFTNDQGERVIKGNDGKYYKPDQLTDKGEPKEGAVGVENPELRTVNADGTTTKPVTLNNVASALGLDSTAGSAISKDTAKTNVESLLTKSDKNELNKVVTLRDLQALAQAGLDFSGNTGSTHRALGTTLAIKGKSDVTSYDTDYTSDNVATKVTEGNVEIGFKKSPTFENVTATGKVTTPELVLKGKDNSGDVTLKADSGKVKVNDKEIATKDDLTTAISNKIKLTGDGNTSTSEVALNKEGGISFGIKGTDGIETTASGTDVTLKLSKTITDKLDNISSKSDGRDGKEGKAGETSSATNGLTGKDGLNGKDLTSKVNALRNGEAGSVVFTNDQGERVIKGNDGKYYKPDQLTDKGEPKEGAVGVENPELRTVNADGTTTKPVTLNNVASALGLDSTAGSAISKDTAKTNVESLLTKSDKNELNKVVTLRDLQALAQAGLDFSGNTGSTHRALGTTLAIKGKSDVTSYDTDYTSDNVATKVTEGNVEIGFKKSPTFENVTATGKVTTPELVLKGKDNSGDVTLKADSGKVKVNDKEIATKDDLTTAISNKIKLTGDGNTSTSEVALNKEGGISFGIKGTDGIETTASGTDVTLKLSKTITDKLDNISSKSDGRDGKEGKAGETSSATNGLTGKDGLNGKDLTSKVNALRNGEAGSVVFTNDQGERVIKGNDGKYYKPDQLTDKGEPKEGAVGVENPELRTVNADGTTTKPVTLNNVASALGLDSTAGSAISKDTAKTNVESLLTKSDKNELNKVVTLRDLQALAQAGLDFSGNTGSTHRALGTTLAIKGKSDVTSYDTDYTSDNVATKVTEGNVEIGFKKSPTFENVTATGKVTTPELVLKGKDNSGDVTLKADSGKVKVNDKEIATKDDLTTAISNKIKLTGDGNTSTSEVALNKEGGISFGIKGTDGIETTASGTDVTLKLSKTITDKLDNISSKSDGRDGKEGKAGETSSATNGLTGKDGLNGKDLTSKVNALRNGEAGSVVFTNDQGERVIKGNDGKYYKPDQLTDKGEPKEGAVGVENPELRTVNADGTTTKPVTLNNVASALGLDSTAGSAISKDTAKTNVESLLTKSDKNELNKVVTLRDLQALAQAGLDFSGNTGSTHRALGTTLAIKGKSDVTSYDTDYTSDNVATKVTEGNVEIGFKKSPTFENVTATGKVTTPELVLKGKDNSGDVTLKADSGKVKVNDKEIATKDDLTTAISNKIKLTGDGNTSTSEVALNKEGGISFGIKGTDGIETTASGTDVTLKLSKTITDKLDNISSKSDGRDGKEGKAGETSSATNGLTGKDGLNGKDLTSKVNALRNGEAGSVVFTNDQGERVIKGNDGKYYKPDQLTDKGEPKEGAVGVENPELRTVNADGTTTKPVTLNNVASALGLDSTAGSAISKDTAKTNVESLLTKSDKNELNKVVTLRDLQALAQAGLDFSGNTGSTHRALGTTLAIKGKSDVTSYDTDYTSDNVATKVTEGNVEIGFKKSPTFENVTATGKVTTPELVLKGKDNSGDVTLKADSGKVKVNDKEIATKDDLTTAISNKIKLTGDGNTSTSEVALNKEGGISFGIKGTDGIETTASGTDVTLKLSKTITDKLDNISSKSDGRDGKEGKAGETSSATNGLTGKDGLNGKDLTSKVNALRNGEAGSVVFTNDQGERVIKGNDGKYYKPDQLTDKGEPKEGAVGVENPELRTVNADGTTTKPVTLNNVASALGLDSTAGSAISKDTAKTNVESLLTKSDKNELNKVVTLRDLQALAQAGLDFSGNTGSTHRALGTTLAIKGKSDVTSYDTDYTSDNVATKVTEGNVEIGFKKSPTFENVTATGKVTTPELVLKGKDNSGDVTLKADSGKVKVNDKEIATKDDLTTAISNKIKLTGDGNTSTSEVALNKEGGISFGIKGTDGIETTASGTDVTLKLSKTITDKLDNISSKSDGRDGKEGKAGETSSATNGLTGKDGLNGKDLTSKVNALRNGEAGSVVFTNDQGERVIKGNDGKYYKPDQLTDKGEPKEGAVGVENPELRTVNADGTTTKPVTLNNVASALGLDSTAGSAISKDTAKTNVESLLTKSDKNELNKVVTLRDLQALAQAGLDFSGNTGSTHRALGTTLNIAGQGTTSTGFVGAEGNINVVASEATADKVAKLEIQLAKALKNIESIQNGETKVTLGENGVSVSGKDGGSISVNGKDGKPGVTINGGNGTNGSINFAKDGDKGTGSITGLKDPDGKDKTAAATVNYVTNQIEGAKNDIANNIKNIVDGGMTYKGNSGEDVKVKLNESLNIKGEGDYKGDKSASGNIAVVGKTDKTLEIKLNKNLNNIESIQNGETKVTLGENGVSVSGKDGGLISVNGKDGKPGVTINGGNGKDGSINFAKDGDKGTGSITGLKDPDGSDKTAVTTVNYVTNAINNATNSLTDKGLNFEGNDGNAVTKKLGETLSIKGEGTVTGSTATNNIKVSKDTTGKSTGLVVGLAEKLTGMTGFETKEEDGKKVSINKDGITFAKNGENGTGVITGLKDSTDKTSAVTRGAYDKFVKEIESKLDKSGSIKYSADKGTSTVALDKGMTFNGDGNITTEAKDNGIVEFKLNKNITLGSKGDLGTIKGIKTIEGDPTSVATVDYVESKVGDSVKVSHKALVGVANAVAMANLPQVNSIGNNRHVVSAAYGNYEGQNALALGISGINKERTFIYRGSASLNTNGKIALGAGIGYQFGKDDHDEIQNDASIKVLKEEIAALKDKDSKNTNVISELKELMKKKDIENDYKTYRLEEENKAIKSYIEELRKENEKTREELNKLLDAFKSKK